MRHSIAIGIDLGASFTKIGLIKQTGEILKKARIKTQKDDPEEFFDELSQVAHNLSSSFKIDSLGIGVPGPLDSQRATIHEACNLGWRSVPVLRLLKRRFDLPVWVENDANLACFAELKNGAAKGTRNAVLFTLGSGIGGGVIINGELYTGSHGQGAELGHMTIESDGPRCNCGNKGCLEAFISSQAIIKRYYKLSRKMITDREIFVGARRGDRICKKIAEEFCKYLAIGIANVVHVFDPEAVILSGGLSYSIRFYLKDIISNTRGRLFELSPSRVTVVTGKLGNWAGIIGAGLWALKRSGISV